MAVKIYLGAGRDATHKDFLKVDQIKHPNIDIVHDLNKYPWPFKDNSIDVILAFHVLEHLTDFERAFKELTRILKQGGVLHIKVPHFSAAGAFLEFHRTFFWYNSFTSKRMLSKNNLETSMYDKFELKFRKICFEKKFLFYNRLVESLINQGSMPQIYEHTFLRALFPAKEIEFILKKK